MDALNDDALAGQTARLLAAVRDAADVVMALWPLTSFIAANPARVLEREPFEQAVRDAQRRLGGRGLLPPETYEAFAAKGLVCARRLRHAFDRRVLEGGTVTVAGVALEERELLWRAHFEAAYGVRQAGELRAAAAAAVGRVPPVAIVDDTPRDRAGGCLRQVDSRAARWVQAYADAGQATWSMPRRDRGLFAAWRPLAMHDPTLPAAVRGRLADLLSSAADGVPADQASARALHGALAALGIEEADWRSTLEGHLLRLPGWASFLKWRAEQATPGTPAADVLLDYLALRLLYTASLSAERPTEVRPATAATASPVDQGLVRALAVIADDAGLDAAALRSLPAQELATLVRTLGRLPQVERSLIWLEAHEESYRSGLLDGVARHLVVGADGVRPPAASTRPDAQLVFCIDVRSEPFRRNLERLGTYETLGFAGFFGVPIAYRGFDEAVTLDVCPALLKPRYRITEAPSPCCSAEAAAHADGKRALGQLKALVSKLKASAAACYGFVEAVGLGFALPFLGKTFAPATYGRWQRGLEARLAPPIEVTPALRATTDDAWNETGGLPYGLNDEEHVFFAEAALSVMGLTGRFARLVVLLGHGSQTENNPYASALDCGACGGNTGGPSARVLATLLNDPAVRAGLAERGIAIPDDTWFLAGQHNTTTDVVTLYNQAEAPSSHGSDLEALEASLAQATELNGAERRLALTLTDDGSPSAAAHTHRRASDWAQVRPEWGLARNAAFIVGPRWLTDRLHLESRTFLHSYDWTGDDAGKALEIILTAPMVVAEWINTQYYFSTVDNARFGSGSKVTHNVSGRIGVIQGNAGDLQIGLPEQSVMRAEGDLYHEPLRLMTLCLAPIDRVEEIIERNAVLKQLFDHAWVTLVVIDPASGRFRRYAPGGQWIDQGVDAGGGDHASSTHPAEPNDHVL